MIGEDALLEAFTDAIHSGSGLGDDEYAGLVTIESAGVDAAAARAWASEIGHAMLGGVPPGTDVPGLLVMTGLLVGIRAGRADAVRLAEEMTPNPTEGDN